MLPWWNWTLVFLILGSSLNTVLSLLQPKITIISIFVFCPLRKGGPFKWASVKVCQIVKLIF